MTPTAASRKIWTLADLTAFEALQTPLWVFRFDDGQKWWANRRGLELWSANSNEELRARGIGSAMSEATRIRLDAIRRRLEAGETLKERWNFYPTGHPPFVAEAMMSALEIVEAEGGPVIPAMLVEARKLGPDEADPFVRRGVEVLRHLGEMISLYKRTGEVLMRNPAAIIAFGGETDLAAGSDAFLATFASPLDAENIRSSIAAGPVHGDAEVQTKNGLVWHSIDAREATDPITGEPCIMVVQRDITDRVQVERALEESHRALGAQAEELRRLAASPLRVWKGIVALPLIGRIDDARLLAGLESIEQRMRTERVVEVLLDFTGAEAVDAEAANGIRRMIGALRLQGIACRMVGLRPALAQMLVQEGIELGNVPIHASLADALARAIRR